MQQGAEYVHRRLLPLLERVRDRGVRAARAAMPRPDFLRACAWLVKAAGGRPRIPRHMAPR